MENRPLVLLLIAGINILIIFAVLERLYSIATSAKKIDETLERLYAVLTIKK